MLILSQSSLDTVIKRRYPVYIKKPRASGPLKGSVGRSPQEGRCREMVQISVVVKSGTGSFRVRVQAESIERALEIARWRYPDQECQVTFPLDPETYFAAGNQTRQ
jgi:hypothetical protein